MKKRTIQLQISAAAFAAIFAAGSFASAFPFSSPNLVYAEDLNDSTKNSESTTVINETSTWKYLDDNTDPAATLNSLTAWTTPDFNDSAWKSAAGKFGAKKGALTSFNGFTPTVLLQQYQPNDDQKCTPTFFFRTSFNAKDIDKITSITGTLFHDDAVAVYLNGTLIASTDMPTEVQQSNLYYAGVSAGAPKQTDIDLSKDQFKDILKEGSNTLSVELHQDRETSSDIYFEFKNLSLNTGSEEVTPDPVAQKSIFLTVGNDSLSQGITWYANTELAGEVQYAIKSGDTFPENYLTATATSTSTTEKKWYSNQVFLTGLQPNTEYVYRLKNGETLSNVYHFTSGDTDGSYEFSFVGDPQIGAGFIDNDINGWNDTLTAISTHSNADFLLSAGDQVNTASFENQYDGYINPLFTSLPSATTIGNHDSGSAAYNQHFNLPNESVDKGQSTAGSDYWFVYENTLFIDINSNDRSTAEHKAFIEEAIAANPNVKWKTVVFHHSIFSTASHFDDSDIISRRNELPQVFKDLDIDVVLMGHDHVYTRTYMMDGVVPDTSKGVQSSVVNPTGILYLTANSASGSKYYDIQAPDAEFSAKMDQSERRTFTDVKVTDTSYSMTTYYADDMSVLDEFTIYKSDNSALKDLVNEIESLKLSESDYTPESWKTFSDAFTLAKEVIHNTDSKQEVIDNAYASLKNAKENLVKNTSENNTGNNNNTNNNSNQNGGNTSDKNQNSTDKTQQSTVSTVKTGDYSFFGSVLLLIATSISVVTFIIFKRHTRISSK